MQFFVVIILLGTPCYIVTQLNSVAHHLCKIHWQLANQLQTFIATFFQCQCTSWPQFAPNCPRIYSYRKLKQFNSSTTPFYIQISKLSWYRQPWKLDAPPVSLIYSPACPDFSPTPTEKVIAAPHEFSIALRIK